MRSIARTATSVLPEPTSPWSSRCIGCGSGEVGLDLGADCSLTGRQLERQSLVEGRQQGAARAGAGLAAEQADLRPSPRQHQLGHQRLLEAEPALGPGHLPVVGGSVDPVVGRPRVDQVVGVPHLLRDQLRHVVEDGSGERDGPLQVPRLDALGEGVDGEVLADVLEPGRVAVVVVVAALAEQDHLGVGELPGALEGGHLPEEQTPSADRESARLPLGDVPGLREERHLQRRTVGRQHGLEAERRTPGPPVVVGLHVARDDLADDGEELTLLEVGHLGQLAGLDVAAREVVEQVTHGAQAEPLDDLLALARLVAQDRLDRRVEADHVPSRFTRRTSAAGNAPDHRRTPRHRHGRGAPRRTTPSVLPARPRRRHRPRW